MSKKANFQYYTGSSKYGNTTIAFKKCLACGESDLKGTYKYCPMCGRKFKNEEDKTMNETLYGI